MFLTTRFVNLSKLCVKTLARGWPLTQPDGARRQYRVNIDQNESRKYGNGPAYTVLRLTLGSEMDQSLAKL